MKKLTPLFLIAILGLIGCASKTPYVIPEPIATGQPQCKVSIMRLPMIVGSGYQHSVFINEQKCFLLKSGKFFTITLPPGKHKIHLTDALFAGDTTYEKAFNKTEVELENGQEAFYEMRWDYGKLKRLSISEAKSLILKCKDGTLPDEFEKKKGKR